MENVHQFPPIIDRIPQAEDAVEGKRVKKRRLINRLNALNFIGGTLLVNLKHLRYNHTVLRRAKPLPCTGDELVCEWADPSDLLDISAYRTLNVLVPDGPKLILVECKPEIFNEKGLKISLPETCIVFNRRQAQRYACKDIKADLIQNSAIFSGSLLEFSPFSFDVEIHPSPPQKLHWIDPALPATIIFRDEKYTYYSGICKIIKRSEGMNIGKFVLQPLENQTRRFKPREFRSMRQALLPQPNIIFNHPFTKKKENLKVLNLSGSGFSVEESEYNPVLLPGMIIPELQINFAGSFQFNCKAQVVYRKRLAADVEEKEAVLKYGIAILDMDIDEHRKFTSLLYQATDSRACLGTEIDMDALWEFFFNSGLIYPQKYTFLLENKEYIKAAYEKLYNSNPSIARHFIYQDKGKIRGHISMVRFHNNSWLVQHHAAEQGNSQKIGLAVLNQVDRFINDSYKIYSAHMDFVFCYFRPDNKFPDRVFGGVCRHINNPKICSLDNFAYFHFRTIGNNTVEGEDGWILAETQPEDLRELKRFYHHSSGGLMLSGLELDPEMACSDDIDGEFRRMGFRKERHVFSLRKNNRVKAIFILSMSDVGLNLSDLTDCIQAIVLDQGKLPRAIFYNILSQLAPKFEKEEVPVLLYPTAYAETQSVSYEKVYSLWVYDLQHIDYFLGYLKRLIRHIQH